MSTRADRRSAPEVMLGGLGRLGLPRVLLLAVLLGGLGLAALGPLTDDVHAVQVGTTAAAAACLGLLLTVLPSRVRSTREGRSGARPRGRTPARAVAATP